jgi:hypothetical protein
MTSLPRGVALFRAVRYLVENNIEGDIIECGVFAGGSCMIAMETLLFLGAAKRRIVMMDTFEGMTEPGAADIDMSGLSAAYLLSPASQENISCYASLEEVKANVARTGYPKDLVEFIKGDIRETARTLAPLNIALLRLDTDFYDSTKTELEIFYPQIVSGGVLLLDDYGHWRGARKAVDEYFVNFRGNGQKAPFMNVVDYTARLAIKAV